MGKDFKHLKETAAPGVFREWQEVDALIYAFTDLGIKVAINDEYTGLIYKNEVYDEYKKGQRIKAFIKCVRDDGRLDVSPQPRQGRHVLSTTDKILEYLKALGGKISFNDDSSPNEIKDKFKVSKRVFKQAIGVLYKQRKINITNKGIEIVE